MSTTTLATGAPGADVDTEEVSSEPWSMSFDFADDEHCFGDLAERIGELPATVRTAAGITEPDWATYDYYAYRGDLESALDKTRDVLDDLEDVDGGEPDAEQVRLETLERDLEKALADIEPHRYCACASDAWDGLKDWFNSAISGSVETTTWGMFDSGDQSRSDFTSADPTVSTLWKALNSRDGWEAVSLSWDPAKRRLDFQFNSRPSIWSGYAIALTPEQEAAAERLTDLDSYLYQECPRAFVAAADPHLLEVVTNLWDADESLRDRFSEDPQAAVEGVTAQLASAGPEERATLAALSRSWTSSLDTLIDTARTVAAV